MNSFDQAIELMVIEIEQTEGTSILIGVTDDTVLRDHTAEVLRKRLLPEITLRDFRYDAECLSLLEGAVEVTASSEGRRAVSVTGLEALPRDKRTEAIHLLNLQRNRFGRTDIAVILWVNRATLAEISNWSPDFYSWRSATFFIEPPPGWNVLESMRRSYLQALVAQNEFVNLQGLAPMRGGQIVQMRMEDIFIPLRAMQEVGSLHGHRIATSISGLEGAQRIPQDLPQVSGISKQMIQGTLEWLKALEIEMTATEREINQRIGRDWIDLLGAQREVKTGPVEIPELLEERQAVVLGDPGSGKTTLLRYVAYTLARSRIDNRQSEIVNRTPDLSDCLPVYVRIGEYAQHLQQNPEATLDTFAPSGSLVHQLPLSGELLQDAMVHGRVIFLLDGLDEIIDTGQRREIAQHIEKFALAHPRCRMLVTSRIVGYREVQLGGEFSQFTISPFEDDEIRRFAQHWYTALGMPENAEKLVQAIQGNPSIRRLASNPLLLTVIALIPWRGTKLPNHRVTLYRLAAETLVDQWMSHRRVTPEGWDVHETRQVLLPAIAWHLHHTAPSGLIGQEELHSLLVEALRQHDPRLSEREAHSRASQFRRNVGEFSGIFLERGLDENDRGIYGFLHLTFEEYFAALRLADTWQRDGNRVLKPLLHDPRWTEIILLTAGHFGEFSQYQASRFVRTILEAQSEHEDVLYRDLLLAARCLADDVRVDAELRRMILSKLVKCCFARESPHALREDIGKIFARLFGTIMEKDVLKALTEHLARPDRGVRRVAAEAIGQLGPGAATPEILAALLKGLTDLDGSVRWAAAWAFGQLGPGAATPEVLTALLKRLADPNGDVRWAAAWALGRLGPGAATPEVLAALLKCLADQETTVRHAAAWAFGQLGAGAATPEVLAALLKGLAGPDEDMHWAAANALGQLGQAAATAEVLTALLKLLTGPDRYVREAAAEALGGLGPGAATSEVLAALLKYLADPDRDVREAAAGALGQLGPGAATPEVLTALLKCLADPHEDVHWPAADALGYLGQAAATADILTALLKLLTGPNRDVRHAAAEALGGLGPGAATPEVLAALLKCLADPGWPMRSTAARALGRLGPGAATPEVLAALLKCLADPGWPMRSTAAEALGRLGPGAATPEVLAALLKCLADPERTMPETVARVLENLSLHVRSRDRSKVVKLFLPLARSRDTEQRNTGYVALRNLLAAGPA